MLRDARALVEKSRGETPQESSSASASASAPGSDGDGDRDSDRDPAVPRLTAGGIITLERTLAKLEVLLRVPASS